MAIRKEILDTVMEQYKQGGSEEDKKIRKEIHNWTLENIDTEKITYEDVLHDTLGKKLTRLDPTGRDYIEIFAQSAKEEFTSGLLKAETLEPETIAENVFATAGSVAGLVSSLALTGGALKGASLLMKSGRLFQRTSSKLFERAIQTGAFNIHGQLRPELKDNLKARLEMAFTDTSMALLFPFASEMFPPVSTTLKAAGIGTGGLIFGGMSYLSGDEIEVVITNTLAGGLLHGMSILKSKDGVQILKHKAKNNLEKLSGVKIKNGYSNDYIDQVRNRALKKFTEVKTGKDIKKNELRDIETVRRSSQYLKSIQPENRGFIDDPIKNFKITIHQLKKEIQNLTGSKI
ncbi:MAG: hypothetical protein AABY22_35445, partial [Nanoarchaeota archaeon]